jgi:glycosyltransferase involved in cell wall biosynthesis
VLFLGRLEPEKGCFEFIYQFLRAESVISNQIHALIVGSGRSEQDIHNIIIEKNALDKVTFIKRLDHSQVLEAHKCADIYVSLNKRGNLSNANLEAMALGQCIVMLESQPKLSIDSITDSLIPKQAVLRVSLENNISELKDAIVMLHNNPEIREKMKKNIRKVSDKILKSWDERISHEIKILKSMF